MLRGNFIFAVGVVFRVIPTKRTAKPDGTAKLDSAALQVQRNKP